MKRFTFSLLIFLISQSFCSSQKIIEISYEKDAFNNYVFYCDNKDLCKYSVEVNFSGMFNLTSEYTFPHRFDVSTGRIKLFVLKPSIDNSPSSFNASYKYVRGGLNPRVKRDFVYLLPVGNGKETEAMEMKYIKLNEKDPEPKDWYTIGFKMKFHDTVYAARGGLVTDLQDTIKLKLSGYSYSSDDNFVQIYHEDGTFGRYQVLSKVLVKSGEKVNAGEPIGLAGGDKYENGPHVRFSVHYNFEPDIVDKKFKAKANSYLWAYIPVIFYTKEFKNIPLTAGNKYIAEYPESVVTKEMSNREIKKWKKENNIL